MQDYDKAIQSSANRHGIDLINGKYLSSEARDFLFDTILRAVKEHILVPQNDLVCQIVKREIIFNWNGDNHSNPKNPYELNQFFTKIINEERPRIKKEPIKNLVERAFGENIVIDYAFLNSNPELLNRHSGVRWSSPTCVLYEDEKKAIEKIIEMVSVKEIKEITWTKRF